MTPQEPRASNGDGAGRKAARFLAKVGVLRGAWKRREAFVRDTLQLLSDLELIDAAQRARLERLWESGDEAARDTVHGLLDRLARLDTENLPAEWVKRLELGPVLEKLAALDLGPVAETMRRGDMQSFLLAPERRGLLDAVIEKGARYTRRTQVTLVLVGLALPAVAALSYLYPQQARPLLWYGLLVLLAVLGFAALWGAWRISRALRVLDLDLATLSKLRPNERRAILVSRLSRRGQGELARRLTSAAGKPPREPEGEP